MGAGSPLLKMKKGWHRWLQVAIVLNEMRSTATSSATTLYSVSFVVLKYFSILPKEFWFVFAEDTCCFVFAPTWILCFRCRWFRIAPVDPTLQEIVFLQVSHLALHRFDLLENSSILDFDL